MESKEKNKMNLIKAFIYIKYILQLLQMKHFLISDDEKRVFELSLKNGTYVVHLV